MQVEGFCSTNLGDKIAIKGLPSSTSENPSEQPFHSVLVDAVLDKNPTLREMQVILPLLVFAGPAVRCHGGVSGP